jgi:branched-chain amino acid transport system ATP-binding protein
MLEVSDLHVSYGHVRAVSGVDFSVAEGECVALLGGNGAGKTTILNTISGLLKPIQGQIRLRGEEIAGLPPHKIVAQGVVQIPEGRKIFPDLRVYENLLVGSYQRKDDLQADWDRIYELFPVLEERQQQRGETLSGGEQQMLAIGRALMARPRLLMLDEPSLGLAPLIVERLFEVIADLKQEITLLLVEQNAQLALEVADRAYILQQGRITREGTAEQLLSTDWIREAYLGG